MNTLDILAATPLVLIGIVIGGVLMFIIVGGIVCLWMEPWRVKLPILAAIGFIAWAFWGLTYFGG